MFNLLKEGLQWGRAYSARRTDHHGSSVIRDGWLQWGRAYSARRTVVSWTGHEWVIVASMGPGLFSPENPLVVVHEGVVQRGSASMGPGIFSPENLASRAGGHHGRWIASMGPGLFSPENDIL